MSVILRVRPEEGVMKRHRVSVRGSVRSGGNDPVSQVDVWVLRSLIYRGHLTNFLRTRMVPDQLQETLGCESDKLNEMKPATGVVHEEALVGAIDLIAEHAGRTVIVEHKSAARRFAQDRLQNDLQPTAYQFAARELGIHQPRLAFQVLLKTRSPQVEFTTVSRTKEQETEMLSTYSMVLKAVAQGIFWKNRGWMCGDCQYRYRCDDSPGK